MLVRPVVCIAMAGESYCFELVVMRARLYAELPQRLIDRMFGDYWRTDGDPSPEQGMGLHTLAAPELCLKIRHRAVLREFPTKRRHTRRVNATSPTAEEFRQILRSQVEKISSPRQITFLDSILIEPYQTYLSWEYGNDEHFIAWVFADLRERDVIAQYCLGGHGGRGSPWGINFRSAKHFGQDCGWYPGLKDLIEDWGVRE